MPQPCPAPSRALRCHRLPVALAFALVACVPLSVSAADDAASASDLALADPVDLNRVEVRATRQTGYATPPSSAGTGLALTPRETPQSVSVLTRDQLDDFGLDNLNDALESTPGIVVERIETSRTYYTARGFDITNFQFDGLGVPLPYGIQNGDIDTAMFDRIEVLRGANGLMSGTGNPSATINFVRKRPTDEVEGAVHATFGSWDRRRVDADLSGPLGSGAVRGRVVGAYEDGDSYLDRYSLQKSVVYGVVEADLGENTLLTAGVSRQDNDADSPLWGALPLFYGDGTPTGYATGTSTAADWSYWDTRDTRSFVELGHAFGNGWSLRAAVNHHEKVEDAEIFYVYGAPDRDTGLGLFSYPSAYDVAVRALHADVRASGPIELGGRSHELVLGASWADSDVREVSWYGDDIGTPLPPLEQFDGRYPRPAFDLFSDGSDFVFRRDSVYANARWNLADSFRLTTGANHSKVRMDGTGYGTPKATEASKTTPFLGAVWDFAPAYSLYAAYGAIFAQQTELDASGAPLDPIEGRNVEAGVKGEWFGGRLNASASAFRVRQDNLALAIGFDPEAGRSIHEGQDARSDGFEFEVAGELGDAWSLSAGWTRLDIEDADGNDARSYVPRSMLRASAVARIAAVPGLRIGGSLRWQGGIHREAVLSDGSEAMIRQDAYAVLGLMAGYRAGNGWEATLNLDNLTDEKYIPSLYWEQGYYAAPRNVSLTLGYRF
ncbi:TonB-dependent siderophore receptor [Luteimonas sp. SJ-92]|uniref:TonB-dependent siderophore receptor n=1 Tax=Luteimonas salinisoli TaxID=2752307 RepID=A0A853J906_9GAMM|nr:TonB-dependent siderophore receptor [Luteimonas salinisoli]NZA25178.1 TonB-dependent siderophore receptor [Luteimonas salinisoli]